MTDEEIKLRCIEMAYTLWGGGETYLAPKDALKEGHEIFQLVYPYLKEGKLSDEDNS